MSAPPPDDPRAAFDLGGRVAVVTGAARGIGRACARVLAAAGARVVLADLAGEALEEAVATTGDAASGVATDVTDRAQVERLVAHALEQHGQLDVLANVAGVIHAAPVVDTREADLDRVLAVNLKGVYFACQAAARAMTARGRGSIVNISSAGAYLGVPELSAYAMSKAAVVALTRVLAAEIGASGVRVNAVAPGMVETRMAGYRKMQADGSVDPAHMRRVVESARRRNPLGIEGAPEDVAYAVLYLASDAARYTTGQVLHPNGGTPMI